MNVTEASTPFQSMLAGDVICFFGGPCHRLTEPMLQRKVYAVQRHLEEHHGLIAQLSGSAVGCSFRCDWNDAGSGSRCSKEVCSIFQLAKHISTVHLKLFQVFCGGCGIHFSRQDSLDRHLAGGRCKPGLVGYIEGGFE